MLKSFYVLIPSLIFFNNIEMLVLHFLLYWRPCQDLWITQIVIQPTLHSSCLQAVESVLFYQKKHRCIQPSSRMILWIAFCIFRTRNSKSLSISRIRMVLLTFVEKRSQFLVLNYFHFWQLMAYENLMLLQDKLWKF